ncbi:polyhydroxyalkanoate depolymerase [Breoghania sp. L-A4]|uniref:polyhydroxyalkanoate depolymerase n=1 Tax=Breoghania sp. L-A4 TaxID=2304600 RepID=UPI0020BE0F3C|nr:polyhydroxyalkanoate depolymerase [Breoghania sp. L-A4]
MPYYQLYELSHAAISPLRSLADFTRLAYRHPFNPLSYTPMGRSIAAACELFERTTRRYGKPEFGLDTTLVGGVRVPVREQVVWKRPFCNLIHFERQIAHAENRDPKLLIVAPMSGHYATLLRGTVEAMLPDHDVYITDWIDARLVPVKDGRFDLDDYIDYIIEMLHTLGADTHVMAVCQPSVPVLAAVALMEEDGDPYAPDTMTLMGGPIDTRKNPTAVNELAEKNSIEWFRNNVIMNVPLPHPGVMRPVYPGFLQLSGFMSMNLDRHMVAHREFFSHLIKGDGDSAEKHRDFYDEYLAVMDLTAEFYLQTVEAVFIEHALPKGELKHRGRTVNTAAIRETALLTIEGENDDISGVGQTRAAHTISPNIPDDKREHYEQPGVGHYGVFNGSRYRSEIAPRIRDFIRTHRVNQPRRGPLRSVAAAFAEKIVGGTRKKAAKPGSVPAGLDAVALQQPKGAVDDLKVISGIGPKLETALNSVGIFHYWQIADLTQTQITELDERLSFKGRIARDGWIEQARALARSTEDAS